jgi:hypothetical protein
MKKRELKLFYCSVLKIRFIFRNAKLHRINALIALNVTIIYYCPKIGGSPSYFLFYLH